MDIKKHGGKFGWWNKTKMGKKITPVFFIGLRKNNRSDIYTTFILLFVALDHNNIQYPK